MKQFDKIFRQQAEKAFSSYDADHLAKEGWNSFVSKQKGKRRFAIIIPIWAKAASVALLVTVGTYFIYRSFHNKPETATELAGYELKSTEEPVISTESETGIIQDRSSVHLAAVSDIPEKINATSNKVTEPVDRKDAEPADTIISIQQQDSLQYNDPAVEVNLAEALIAGEDEKGISESDPGDEAFSGKKTSLIAGFSGMMSNIEDIKVSSPGISVGFYLEHKITRKLSVRPGLALAKHSYGSSDVSDGKVFMNSATPAGNMTGYIDSYENQIDFITMEVPVNLVYTMLERGNSSLFLSAGVSTLFYLDQHLSSNLTNVFTEQSVDVATGNVYQETRSREVVVESDEKAFSHVDYFGLANLSAGYSLPLQKGGSMLFEPFIQLPVSDLTSFNLRIRYGGLSLKFRFGKEESLLK